MRANRKPWLLVAAVLLVGACGSGEQAVKDRDLGYDAYKAGNYPRARQLLESAYAKAPDDPYIQLNLAATYDRLDQPEKARALYMRVLQSGKNVIPGTTTNGVRGKSLADMAQDSLDGMKK